MIITAPSGTSAATPNSYFVYQGTWQLFVGNRTNNSVSIIDTSTNSVVTTLPVGNTPTCVQITPDGTQAYVASVTNNTVSVINRATNTVTATIPLPGALRPVGLAITPDGTKVYVTNINSGNVSVISTATNTVITTIPIGFRFKVWPSRLMAQKFMYPIVEDRPLQ